MCVNALSQYVFELCCSAKCVLRNVFFFTAPGPVEDLQLNFDPTGDPFNSIIRMYALVMTITWRDPINSNGNITSYEVTVTQTDDFSDTLYNETLTGTSVTKSVMVLPFTSYTVTVTASTSAGQGDPESVVELSPEAGIQTCIIVFYYLFICVQYIVRLVVG